MKMTADKPRIRLRTTDELAAGLGTQDENRAFRAAVVRARQEDAATGVYDTDGILAAVIMPVTQVTREDALARSRTRLLEKTAAFARQEDARIRPAADLPRAAVTGRLEQLLAQIVLADVLLYEAVNEFLPESAPGETLAIRIEKFLRHG